MEKALQQNGTLFHTNGQLDIKQLWMKAKSSKLLLYNMEIWPFMAYDCGIRTEELHRLAACPALMDITRRRGNANILTKGVEIPWSISFIDHGSTNLDIFYFEFFHIWINLLFDIVFKNERGFFFL